MSNETDPLAGKFRERVIAAAEAALEANGSVGPLQLFEHMGVLYRGHVEGWRKGNEHYRVLENCIQLGPEKYQKTVRYFAAWIQARGLRAMEASYTRRTPSGLEPLYVTEDRDPEREKFFRTHYAPAELSKRKTRRLAENLAKPPDLVVFEKVGEEGNCSECGTELAQGIFLFMEKGQPLCLACADLNHLVFLPAGDMTLSRRARKNSALSAVVVRFSRARKRYERQGLLVSRAALDEAEAACAADAPARAARRAQATVLRETEDVQFVELLTQTIQQQFPHCPSGEARAIAAHTASRGSGRVGRSAAGRALDPSVIQLAVIAHIRHEHTKYDELLMQGADRLDARIRVRGQIEEVLASWTRRKD